ncbi:MAG TPA: ABC transporter ATP-binding protein, partial [Acetobacteraceae bacterium]|nr:ABC transporter ATP-binding protein [Acetobacteraceae bacterium]
CGLMLSVTGLEAGYGRAQVLFGVSFTIGAGETLALMGRNGMGKTTTVRALMGLLRPWRGEVTFDGASLAGLPPHRIARAGLGLVPEGRHVFPTLTVEENLIATARPGRWTLARVLALLPRLAERRRHRGDRLSGGEQQMLAIGRALLTNPRLLILDEATEGLAPLLRAEIFATLAALKAAGEAVLVIDKHFSELRKIADRVAILEKGQVVWQGTPAALADDPAAIERHLHV